MQNQEFDRLCNQIENLAMLEFGDDKSRYALRRTTDTFARHLYEIGVIDSTQRDTLELMARVEYDARPGAAR